MRQFKETLHQRMRCEQQINTWKDYQQLVIREIKKNTTMIYHYTLNQMANVLL